MDELLLVNQQTDDFIAENNLLTGEAKRRAEEKRLVEEKRLAENMNLRRVAEETRVAEEKKDNNNKKHFWGDVGYVVLDGKKMSFADYASKASHTDYSLDIAFGSAGTKYDVTLYGYIYTVEEETSKSLGYRFNADMQEGGKYSENLIIDLLFSWDVMKKYNNADDYKNLRKKTYETLLKAKRKGSFVKVMGKSRFYTNTLSLYVAVKTIGIIAEK